MFARVGSWSLLFAKFVPGLSLIAVAMAGVTKMPVLIFLLLDGIGSVLFISAFVALGLLFQDAITSMLSTLTQLGKIGGLIVVAAIGLYLLTKWWRRRLFIRQLRMDRITVAELRKLIDDGQKIIILDVRPKEIRVQEGTIPGAVSAHPGDLNPALEHINVGGGHALLARDVVQLLSRHFTTACTNSATSRGRTCLRRG
jgi:hypothetical protein